MANIDHIIRRINKELVPQFEEKLRAYLADKDRDWLIEQIVRGLIDANVRLETAQDNLTHLELIESLKKCSCTARTERRRRPARIR